MAPPQLSLLPDEESIMRFRSLMLDELDWSAKFMNGVCELSIHSLYKPGVGMSRRQANRVFKTLEASEVNSLIPQLTLWTRRNARGMAFFSPEKVMRMLMGRSKTENLRFSSNNEGLWAIGHYVKLLKGGHVHDQPCIFKAHMFPGESWEGKGTTSLAPCATGLKIAEAVVIGYMCKAFLTATTEMTDI